MSRGERALLAAGAAFGIAALLAALVTIAIMLVNTHHDRSRIDALERKVQVLCTRLTVTGVKLNAQGHATVSTARGC
ncbi:MAG TPA: hypothetical protein VFA97_00580 [Gaiellaceae bacterium]|nr:hypothetical protein [Gaiellaceae bacterium]